MQDCTDKYKDALELLEEVDAQRPGDVNVINNIGLVYLALGQANEAKKHFERGNILSPSNVSVTNNLARALFDLECIEPATEILTRLVDEGFATAETYYFLHSAIMKRGNDIAFIKHAYDMKPLDDGIASAYATALWGQDECHTARQIFLDCCEIIQNKEFLQTEPSPKRVSFNPEDAVIALIDLKKVLEPISGNYWLDFGTLLGFIREGGPLKHDKDADIGVSGNIDRTALTQLIKNSIIFDLHPKSSLDEQKIHYSFSIVHKKLGILIDIFFYNQNRDGSFACGFWKHPVPVTWSFDNIPRLGKITVDGNDFPVPDDPSKHLEKIYGPNWMVPDKLFDTVLSAHNLCRSSLETSTLFGLQRLINSVRTGRIEKAIYYLDVIQGFDANLPLKELKLRLQKEL
ncbi:tetratricopeptide repeat protein [Yoonia vestfoldensis]|nr:tetratricopeptide repeat protein [Yoonia vestfoldensis]